MRQQRRVKIAERVRRLSVEGEDANNSNKTAEAPPYITADQTQPDSNRKHSRSDGDDKAVSASRVASWQHPLAVIK